MTSPVYALLNYQMSISDPDAKIAANKHLFLAQLGKVNEMDHVIVRGKTKPFALQTRSKRGSRYRGVSKNGSKWQVMVVRGEIKKYVGAIDIEEVAACIYDKHALLVQGFEVSVTLARFFHFRGSFAKLGRPARNAMKFAIERTKSSCVSNHV